MIRGAAPLALALVVACASPAPPRGAPRASASVSSGAAMDCGPARERVSTLVDAGRLESALSELRGIAERCGPLDATLAAQRDALRVELGDPPGDAPAPDAKAASDTMARARALVETGVHLDATNDVAGAERAFARARRMLERITGKRAGLEGLTAFAVESASKTLAVYSASTRSESVQVAARIDATGVAIPTRIFAGTRWVVAGPRAGSFALLGSDAAYYPSPEADPVPLGSALGAVFSPSGATLVTLDKSGIDVRDGVTGALRDHFTGLIDDANPIWDAAFLSNETLFVGSLAKAAGAGAVVVIDLAAHELLVNESAASSALSRSGRYVAIAGKAPNPVVTAKIWDTRRPRDAPKTADLGPLSGMVLAWLAIDRGETRLVLATMDATAMGNQPPPSVEGAVDVTTGKHVSKPTEAELRLSPTQDWTATAPAYVGQAKGDLIPTTASLYYPKTTIARSRDDATLALVEGTYADSVASNMSVLVIDAATRKVVHRVPIESSVPTLIEIAFGPGDWLAFRTTQGVLGFIDRRSGEVQLGPVPVYPDEWGSNGDVAWSADRIRDLEAKRDITIGSVDFKATTAWFDHPDLRAVPAGVYCRVGEWVFAFALCRDRLRSTR